MTPLAIDRSWQSGNERADNLFFGEHLALKKRRY